MFHSIVLSLAIALPGPSLTALFSPTQPNTSTIESAAPIQTSTTSVLQTSLRKKPSSDTGIAGLLIAENHRSTVTAFVETIMSLATGTTTDRMQMQQLREIALHERDAEASTTTAIQKIAFRSTMKNFINGNDSDSLTVLKNSVAAIEYDLNQLDALLPTLSYTSSSDLLSRQAAALQKDRAVLSSFISNHENATPLLGWLLHPSSNQ